FSSRKSSDSTWRVSVTSSTGARPRGAKRFAAYAAAAPTTAPIPNIRIFPIPLPPFVAVSFTEPLDEPQGAVPGVLGRLRELFLLAVEEAVRRTVIDDNLMFHAGRAQGSFERIVFDLPDV